MSPALALAFALASSYQGPAVTKVDDADSLKRHIYPLAKPMACPPVVVDYSDYPQAKAWVETAKHLVEMYYTTVTGWLATDGRDPVTGELTGQVYKGYPQIKLTVKKEISAPAWAAGGEITINGKWITEHPDDLGMIIHELTHVIQSYDGVKEGWLVEGIADYTRWWRYEPELHATRGRTKITATSKYTDSYRTTALWLAWVSRKYDMRLVPSLDFAMRNHKSPMPVFTKLTGKDADALWTEFAADFQG